jgi:putative addiction module killer protein
VQSACLPIGDIYDTIKWKLREYEDERGRSPIAAWYQNLDSVAAAKVTVALTRLGLGNTSRVKGVGAGVLELKLDFGPGYRVYFGKDGDEIVILLGGGTKKRQQRDIESALARWQNYMSRKKDRR